MNQVQINPDETSVKSWDDLHKVMKRQIIIELQICCTTV